MGPKGPVSAVGLSTTNYKSTYDPGTNGPEFLVAKLSVLSDLGEGITIPSIVPQVSSGAGSGAVQSPPQAVAERRAKLGAAHAAGAAAHTPSAAACRPAQPPPPGAHFSTCALAAPLQTTYPNGGEALYGPYDGSLGKKGLRLRLRLIYSGGKSPSAAPASLARRALQPQPCMPLCPLARRYDAGRRGFYEAQRLREVLLPGCQGRQGPQGERGGWPLREGRRHGAPAPLPAVPRCQQCP